MGTDSFTPIGIGDVNFLVEQRIEKVDITVPF